MSAWTDQITANANAIQKILNDAKLIEQLNPEVTVNNGSVLMIRHNDKSLKISIQQIIDKVAKDSLIQIGTSFLRIYKHPLNNDDANITTLSNDLGALTSSTSSNLSAAVATINSTIDANKTDINNQVIALTNYTTRFFRFINITNLVFFPYFFRRFRMKIIINSAICSCFFYYPSIHAILTLWHFWICTPGLPFR